MKKILIFTFFILIILGSMPGFFEVKVEAEETVTDSYGYTYSCGEQYEVDYINDNGQFEVKGCYLGLSDAKKKMKENEDYVVRYSHSKSAMKIVAMNGGLVYGYPLRKNANTLYVYEGISGSGNNIDYTGLTTYVSTAYEMVYEDTVTVVDSKANYLGYGIIKVNLNGFDGYTDLELVDLVPFKFIDKEIACTIGQNSGSTSAVKFIPRQNYFVARKNGNYRDLCINYAIGVKHKTASDASQSGEMAIGVAPEEMKTDTIYYSKDGVTFYKDSHYTKYAFTNYNYFQFVSLRSKSSVTAKQLNAYLKSMNKTSSAFYGDNAQAFIDGQNTYGMNALLMFAFACNESSYGTRIINSNNIFGLGAYDGYEKENAYAFDSIADCISDMEGWHLCKYCDYYYAENSGYVYYTAPYFGNKGIGISVKYMSDPYECYKVASIAYKVDKFINDNDGTLSETGKYDLALVNEKGVSFKASADSSGSTLYKSYAGNNSTYQKDCVVTVLSQEGSYAKVISGNPIDANRKIIKTNGLTKYNSDLSYAYVSIDKLTPLTDENMFNSVGDFLLNIEAVEWNEDALKVKGNCARENLNSNADITLLFEGKKDYSFVLSQTRSDEWFSFDSDLDLSSVPVGTYKLVLVCDYENGKTYDVSTELTDSLIPLTHVLNGKVYSFESSNGILLMNVAEVKESYESLLTVKNLNLVQNEENRIFLEIEGVGALKGIDSGLIGDTEHTLILRSLSDNSESEIELENTESIFSINDGCDYSFAGFKGSVDVSDLPNDSYVLLIRTSVDSLTSTGILKSAKDDFSNIVQNCNESQCCYRIHNNDLELYEIELDKEFIREELDYETILKPQNRTSFTNITGIEFNENTLYIRMAAMIYYLDYDNEENLDYHVYLVNEEKTDTVEMDVKMIENKYSYQNNFRSSYNMDHISIESCIDLNELEEGEYRIVIHIVNSKDETWCDYVELTDSFHIDRPSSKLNDKTYSFFISNIRDRLMLKVEETDEIPLTE